MGRRFRYARGIEIIIPWIGSQNTMSRGFDIPWVGGQNIMGRGVKIPWVWVKIPPIEGSIYHG